MSKVFNVIVRVNDVALDQYEDCVITALECALDSIRDDLPVNSMDADEAYVILEDGDFQVEFNRSE